MPVFLPEYLTKWPVMKDQSDLDKFIELYKRDSTIGIFESRSLYQNIKTAVSAMVRAGTFREDLYFRLSVFPITIPPLRHRIEDIPALLDHFIAKTARCMKLRKIPGLKRGALAPLLRYDWPGNIRELENIVERAMIIKPEGPLEFNSMMNISGPPPTTGE